jgi:hypothetical protein
MNKLAKNMKNRFAINYAWSYFDFYEINKVNGTSAVLINYITVNIKVILLKKSIFSKN